MSSAERRQVVVLGCALALCVSAAAAPARAARPSGEPRDCGKRSVVCTRVSVPLDWSGQMPGRLSLQVEVQRAPGAARGVMFLMAGGPGQASTRYFDIGEYGYWSLLFRGYTLVTFDPRGDNVKDIEAIRRAGQSTGTVVSRAAAVPDRAPRRPT